jgi:predicted secreted protein
MNTRFRVLAVMGILIVAATGCGKGKSPEATGTSGKSEAVASSSKGAKAHAKSAAAHAGRKTEMRGHDTDEANGASRSGGRRVSTLTMADDGGTFTLAKGQVLSVILDANHSAGSSWNMVESSLSVIEVDGKPVYVMKPSKAGSAGTETWHFRAALPGRQTVRLEYGRPWARHVPERTFRFTVTVR